MRSSAVFVIGALAVFAAAYALSFLRVCHRFSRILFRRSACRVVACDEIPEDVRARLETSRPFLESQGFVLRRCLCEAPEMELPEAKDTWEFEFRHPEAGAFALVAPHPQPSFACYVEFVTCFRNGEIWSTVNGIKHLMIPERAGERTFFDDCLVDDRAAWEAHCRRVRESGKAVLMDEREAEERLTLWNERAVERRVGQGVFKPASAPGRWTLTWSAIARWVWRINAGKRKAGRVRPPEAETRFWQQRAETEASRQNQAIFRATGISRRGRAILFVLSAALFVAAGRWLFGAAATWALLGALALHEGGHWLAMKLTGHRNLSVFFIPGLGALTAGEKSGVTPMQRLVILLAGPVPGLVLGVGGAMVATSLYPLRGIPFGLLFSIVTLVLLNYLNLLPLFPLDGGRLVDALFLSRFPRLRFAFALLSFAGLVCAAAASTYYLADRLMWVFALLMLPGLPGQWHLLTARLAFGSPGVLTEEAARERAFEVLQAPRFAKWTTLRRNRIAGALISEAQSPAPRLGGIVFALVVYGLCLWLPVVFCRGLPMFALFFGRLS